MMLAKPLLNLQTPVGIAGLGISGKSTLNLLLAAGLAASEIKTFDKASKADFSDPDAFINSGIRTMILSPGIPMSSSWVQSFINHGGLIESELSLANLFLASEKLIGITGSVGKSTCTSLLGVGLKSFDENGFCGGNLGLPLAEYALSVVRGGPRAQWIILELSSYQLENFRNLVADVSGIVSLTPNHMERYADLDQYYLTKKTLLEKTRGICVCNKAGGDLYAWLNQHLLPHEKSKVLWSDRSQGGATRLLGLHNLDNMALATKISEIAGWPSSTIRAMEQFPGLPHRLENVGERHGVLYVNDSKATTIQSVLAAVSSLKDSVSGKIHLLLGGKDKKLPWQELACLKDLQIHFYFFGQCGDLAKTMSDLPGSVDANMSTAISRARAQSRPGDLVLLSPGGTSLDEFGSFEERGDKFKKLILDQN